MFRAERFLLDHFRDPAYVRDIVSAYGFEAPSEPAVAKWFLRNSVPPGWLVRLLGVLELENGAPVSVLPYLNR